MTKRPLFYILIGTCAGLGLIALATIFPPPGMRLYDLMFMLFAIVMIVALIVLEPQDPPTATNSPHAHRRSMHDTSSVFVAMFRKLGGWAKDAMTMMLDRTWARGVHGTAAS